MWKPTPINMYLDLLKQGFMKAPRVRRVKKPAPVISCSDCLNWHQKGKHTADAATRKANRAANKEAAERINAVSAEVAGLLRK
jgi:hypothetical protein